MTAMPRAFIAIITLLAFLAVVALARELGAREAREKIAAALGFDKPDRVHIKSITPGSGNQAIVEAQFDAAFRFNTDQQGNWQAVELIAAELMRCGCISGRAARHLFDRGCETC